jgi:hypothetical protein
MINKLTQKQVLNSLKAIQQNHERTELEKATARILSNNITVEENPQRWFRLFWENDGCQSGLVKEMIFYKDTYQFFDKHSEEILGLFKQEVESGFKCSPDMFTKSELSHFAFEQVASDIQVEIYNQGEIKND